MTTRGGGRDLKVRVKTGRRSLSSKLWLERQLNDPYVARAKREGFRGRAAFKLIEIDDKYRLLKKGGRVVDLGAAPGGWSQVAAKRVGAEEGKGKIVAIDLLPMAPLPGVQFIELDFLDPRAPEAIKSLLGGPADVVLSDMARGSADRYFQQDIKDTLKLVPEGVEGQVPYKGAVATVLHQLAGGLRAAMGYVGAKDLQELHEKAEFVRISGAGMRESHVHDVIVTRESPNYPSRA